MKSSRFTVGAVLLGLISTSAGASDTETFAAADYRLQCEGCHLASGEGGADIPTLHGVGALLGRPGGREYLARVPGVVNASVDDARLAALLNWVLERWSASVLPEEFQPYRAEEVDRWRSPLADPGRARARLTRTEEPDPAAR